MKKLIVIVIFLLFTNQSIAGVLDNIQSDMGLNEAPLMNTTKTGGWAKGAVIDMGSAPRGDATQSYWLPSNQTYKNSDPWKTVIPWFVIYPGTNHTATNVRVKFYSLKLFFLLKSTNTWKKIDTVGNTAGWAKYMNFSLNSTSNVGTPVARREPDGNFSYKLTPEFNPIHGGYSRYALIDYGINPLDISAVFMQIKTELILDNPAYQDDRMFSEILVQVGGDYYPTMSTQVSDYSPMKYAPAIGSSRFGIISGNTRTHYFATINPPGTKNDSVYVSNGGKIVIPVSVFGDNIPAHLFDTNKPDAITTLKYKLTKYSSSATVDLSWIVPFDNVSISGYKIFRNGKIIGISAAPYFKDTLNTKGTYKYTIKSFDDTDNISEVSNEVKLTY